MSPSFNRRQAIASAAAAVGSVASVCRAQETPAKSTSVSASPKAVVDWPIWDESEQSMLLDVLNSGKWGRVGGDRRVAEFEKAFATLMKAGSCIATSSGTTALLTTLGALNIGPGDEVILPPYTFVATFNAITSNYALPVFVDSDIESFQIDPNKIASAINAQTKLVMPVHIGGSVADLDRILSVAKSHGVPVIEDACQAPLAAWKGQPVGSIGLGGCFSFQSSKNLTSGEGGAIVTNDQDFANKCFNFHTPGGGKPAKSLGRGSNFRLTEFQAALLLAQFPRLEEQARKREANANYLNQMLSEVPGLAPAKLTKGCTRSAWHLYMFRYDASQFANLTREGFLKELGKAGINASPGYSTLNTTAHVKAISGNPHYLRIYGKERMEQWVTSNACPVNDRLCREAVWFTQDILLKHRSEMERIVQSMTDIQKRAGSIVDKPA